MGTIEANVKLQAPVSNTTKLPLLKGIPQLFENILAEKNSYGRQRLSIDRIGIEHQGLINDFLNHFSALGYSRECAVDINNNEVDNSVYFIGAPISVLKPYIVGQNIPNSGIYIHQECIRTKNTKSMLDDSIIPPWGSCFSGLATLVSFEERKRLAQDAISYFLETLKIPLDQIRIQINSKDLDLIDLLKEVNCPIGLIFNEKPSVYYTHKYGMGEIIGRNFNFVLREKKSEKFNDIGNYIFIENKEEKYGVELALGTSAIMKEIFELDHIMDASIVSGIFPAEIPLMRKFQDCIVSGILLYRLGIRPNASNTKGRILRSYLRGIAHFRNQFGLSKEKLLWGIQRYELLEFGVNTDVTDFIANYLGEK